MTTTALSIEGGELAARRPTRAAFASTRAFLTPRRRSGLWAGARRNRSRCGWA